MTILYEVCSTSIMHCNQQYYYYNIDSCLIGQAGIFMLHYILLIAQFNHSDHNLSST